MSPLVANVTWLLSLMTIGGEIGLVVLFVAFWLRKDFKLADKLVVFFGNNSLLFGFIIALSAMACSLFYSIFAGFEPCNLCWVQRIFIYPQFFVLALAAWRKDYKVIDYMLLLSVIGALVAAYNIYIQLGGNSLLPCAASGVSCNKIYFTEFGFVTIPVMSLTAFLMSIGIFISAKLTKKI